MMLLFASAMAEGMTTSLAGAPTARRREDQLPQQEPGLKLGASLGLRVHSLGHRASCRSDWRGARAPQAKGEAAQCRRREPVGQEHRLHVLLGGHNVVGRGERPILARCNVDEHLEEARWDAEGRSGARAARLGRRRLVLGQVRVVGAGRYAAVRAIKEGSREDDRLPSNSQPSTLTR